MSTPFAPPPPPAASYSPSGPSGPRAGFWQRFAAYFLDGIIVAIIPGILLVATGNRALFYVVALVIDIAYITYLQGGPTGQTIGMRALGIRVYDFRQGGPIGYGRGFIRFLGLILCGIPCYLGFLWMLWDKEKQTWADKLAGSVVVPVAAYPIQ
jgi:uncharacterized RDD family membrane protein YckC